MEDWSKRSMSTTVIPVIESFLQRLEKQTQLCDAQSVAGIMQPFGTMEDDGSEFLHVKSLKSKAIGQAISVRENLTARKSI